MNELKALQTLGLIIPSPAKIFGSIIFGMIGYVGYRHGQKVRPIPARWIGVTLIIYPYVISGTWQLYAVGVALCMMLYAYRR